MLFLFRIQWIGGDICVLIGHIQYMNMYITHQRPSHSHTFLVTPLETGGTPGVAVISIA